MSNRLKENKLVEIADINMGQSPPSSAYNFTGVGLPFFQGKTDFGLMYPTIRQYTTVVTKEAEKGDILFTVRAPVGDMNISPVKCCIGRGLAAIKPKIDYWYFYYLVINNKSRFIERSAGTVYDAITKDSLAETKLGVHEENEQKVIGTILSKYDLLIENNNKRIKILEEMAQTLYNEWFVNFRYPGHEKVKMVDSELGKIPEGWGVDTLRNNIEHYIGGGWGQDIKDTMNSSETYVIRGTDIPYLLSGDISHTVKRFEKESRYLSRKMQEGDVVFEVSGGSKDQPLGRAVTLSKNMIGRFVNVIPASFCKLIRFKIYPFYFYQLLVNFYKTKYLTKFQVQSTGLSNYNFEAFIDSKVIIPDKVVFQEFNDISSTIVNYIHTLGEKNQTLKETRDLLIPKLISGDIDVSEMDI